jgi:hypothetical protein
VERLFLLTEHCPRNAEAINACGNRWVAAGREVKLVRPMFGKDLNDSLIESSRP